MRLAAIFSEHMILQRDQKTVIFGETEGKARIRVTIDEISVEEDASGGRFSVTLPAHPAGGPYTLTVTELGVTGDGERDEESAADEAEEFGDTEALPDEDEMSDFGGLMDVAALEGGLSVLDEKVISDVYFGEVWIANGQSNIEFEIQNAQGGEEELAAADFPLIRCFKSIKTPVIDENILEQEQHQQWMLCTDGAFREMSGVGYFFAKKIYEALGVPVGMVDCYQGGSSISCWLSEERLKKYPEGRVYQEEFEEAVKGQTEEEYDRLLTEYNRLVAEYQERERIAKAKNPDITPEELFEEAGGYPWPPPKGLKSAFRPSGLYHTMLERITPYTAKGILYYQGEEDSPKASGYRVLLTELIDEFRTDFASPEIPVVILQLPMFIERNQADCRDWAYIREAQAEAVAASEGTVLVPLIDLGEYDNVHPVDKKTPGERTAGQVLCAVYNNREHGRCPMQLESIEAEGNRVVLHFKGTCGNVVSGKNDLLNLRAECTEKTQNPRETAVDPQHIYGFEVRTAGEEEWIVPKSVIDGETVVLTADSPIEEVRYGFFNYGKVSLYNGIGYPLAPFRRKVTD